jgi:hypothetical protein
MMSCTGRSRFLDHGPNKNKRQKVSESSTVTTLDPPQDDWTMLRRLSVVFSSVTSACSLDYIISAGGVCILSDGETASLQEEPFFSQIPGNPIYPIPLSSQLALLDIGSAEDLAQTDTDSENYWDDDIPDEVYHSVDLAAMAESA